MSAYIKGILDTLKTSDSSVLNNWCNNNYKANNNFMLANGEFCSLIKDTPDYPKGTIFKVVNGQFVITNPANPANTNIVTPTLSVTSNPTLTTDPVVTPVVIPTPPPQEQATPQPVVAETPYANDATTPQSTVATVPETPSQLPADSKSGSKPNYLMIGGIVLLVIIVILFIMKKGPFKKSMFGRVKRRRW